MVRDRRTKGSESFILSYIKASFSDSIAQIRKNESLYICCFRTLLVLK